MSVYRESDRDYVERCYCEQPATWPCACCGRARCDDHLVHRLCHRCDQAVTRAMTEGAGTRWWVASGSGVGVATVMLCLHLMAGTLVGIPFAVVIALVHRAMHRARFIREAGPVMRASKGELPEPERKPDFGRDREKFGRHLI